MRCQSERVSSCYVADSDLLLTGVGDNEPAQLAGVELHIGHLIDGHRFADDLFGDEVDRQMLHVHLDNALPRGVRFLGHMLNAGAENRHTPPSGLLHVLA